MGEVRNKVDESRYEIFVDGRCAGFMTYRLDGDTVITPHTEIDDAYGGQGLGEELVQTVLDEIRDTGSFVQPECPFVRGYIDKNPDYQDLVKES